jgi:hypothetical protein
VFCFSFPDFNQGIHWIHLGDPDRLQRMKLSKSQTKRFSNYSNDYERLVQGDIVHLKHLILKLNMELQNQRKFQ